MITRVLAALAAAFLLATTALVAPTTAAAETACTGELTALRSDVLSAPIEGGKVEKERAGLLEVVDDAAALAEVGKPADAVVKLTNLQLKVDQLAAAGRISAEAAALLTADIAATAGCLAA